jgi:hypothetical protein
VQLYRALGGGWRQELTQPTAATEDKSGKIVPPAKP